MPDETPAASTAQRLLDAQVAWLLARLDPTDDAAFAAAAAEVVDDLLAAGADLTVASLVDAAAVKDLLHLVLAKAPSSAAASTVVGVAADTLADGPRTTFTVGEVIDRDRLADLLEALSENTAVVAAVLDRVAESPLAAGAASRFVTRIVGEVLATNKAVADKIPGLGSMVSLGTSVAGRMAGVADKQLEAMLGETAGKGATFAMRRLNKVLVDTLKDPATRAAALEVFDLYADRPVDREDQPLPADEVHRIAGILQDLVITGAPSAPVKALVDALVDGVLGVYGEHPVATLVDDLGLTRDDLVGTATALAGPLLRRAIDSGHAERLLRAHLEPFFSSPEVAAILG